MTPAQSNPASPPTPEPFRWTRPDASKAVHDFTHPDRDPTWVGGTPARKRTAQVPKRRFRGLWIRVVADSTVVRVEDARFIVDQVAALRDCQANDPRRGLDQ